MGPSFNRSESTYFLLVNISKKFIGIDLKNKNVFDIIYDLTKSKKFIVIDFKNKNVVDIIYDLTKKSHFFIENSTF